MHSFTYNQATGSVDAHDRHAPHVEEDPAIIGEAVYFAENTCPCPHEPNDETIEAMLEFQPPDSEELPPLFPVGKKFDSGKLDWTLLPFSSLEGAVKVLMFGAEKYDRENWKLVKNGTQRYTAACLRHLLKHMDGEEFDPETGLRHTAHAMVNLLFIEWLRANGGK
jgi:hypothetical protein